MSKVAIICQRYGIEVNGGAEYHARLLAEKLAQRHAVEVITTTAIDYHTWDNHYPEGCDCINGIEVHRFKTIKVPAKKLRKSRRIIQHNRKYFKVLKKLRIFNYLEKKFKLTKVSKKESQDWLTAQGPYCPELITYIKKNKTEFDVFIFFTYLYYPTAVGMPLISDNSIFIPTAHDEPILYTEPYKTLFAVPRFIMYNTLAEKRLIENRFDTYTKFSDIAGVGFNQPDLVFNQDQRSSFNYDFNYFVYIGRIEINKGCEELITFFKKFANGSNIKLILIGRDFMNVQTDPSIIKTGFISERDKCFLLKNCKALIIPSKFESLSLVTLEAMAARKIVVANAKCEVLADHIYNSRSGFLYNNFEEFKNVLDTVLRMPEKEIEVQGLNASEYVSTNYSWEKILDKFDKAIDFINQSKK